MDIGSLLYFGLLAVWSGAIAYGILFRAAPFVGRVAGGRSADSLPPDPHEGAKHTAEHLEMFLPQDAQVVSPPTLSGKLSKDGFKAFATGTDLTVEDIVTGLSRG